MRTRKDYALTPEQRNDARDALAVLAGSGVSLAEAARRAMQGRRALRRISVAVAIDEFVRTRIQAGKRPRTVEWYEDKLRLMGVRFGSQCMDDVDRAELLAWVGALPGAAGSRAAVARAARALWRWGMAQEPQVVATNITLGLATTGPANMGDAGFLTVDEVARIMGNAGPYRSALALLLFGGVRPEEMRGRGKAPLLWRHVRAAEQFIRIPAEVAKTGKPRTIEDLPPAVWRWLQPGDDAAPVSPGRTRQALERAQAVMRREWPHDATRHTFASYALALTGDAGKVATWLGHEGRPTMLHRHYRGLTTKPDAERFFALAP